jgi:hypothetical protein
MALRFAEQHHHRLQFVPAWGWLVWSGTHWRRDDMLQAFNLTRDICREEAVRAKKPLDRTLIATLWQRISDKGNEYLSGFHGKARVIGFRGQPTADGIPTWDICVQPGKEQDERASARAQVPRQSTTSDRSSCSSNVPRARGVQYQQPQEAADDRPFYDDPVGDVGLEK